MSALTVDGLAFARGIAGTGQHLAHVALRDMARVSTCFALIANLREFMEVHLWPRLLDTICEHDTSAEALWDAIKYLETCMARLPDGTDARLHAAIGLLSYYDAD